jgi:hypothetical protein
MSITRSNCLSCRLTIKSVWSPIYARYALTVMPCFTVPARR